MRQANVYYNDDLAGLLIETDDGDYIFQYEKNYVLKHPDQLLTFSMPVREEPYRDIRLFPVFEGLIPEGWLLNIASKSWRIDPEDKMGLLLVCCQNCIGAISVVQNQAENGE